MLEAPGQTEDTPTIEAEGDAPSALIVGVDGHESVTIPGGEAILKGAFMRDGRDLVIEGADGSVTVIQGFFEGDSPPDIVTGGAVLKGKMAARLASEEVSDNDGLNFGGGDDVLAGGNEEDLLGAATREKPAQEAALPAGEGAREAVARVSEFEGEVVILRADGRREVAEAGTELYEDDVVTTDEGGSVGITFVDGMSFSLGEAGRLLLDEFRYEPDAHEGGGLLSVLQGQFSFVSGEAAHTAEDALMIETPTMTIGVRGTKVVAQAAAEGETSRIALLAEEDGTVGKIMVTTDEGSELIAEANMMVEVVSRFQAPSRQLELSSDQVHDFFSSALSVLPAPAEFFRPDSPEDASDDFASQGRAEGGERSGSGPAPSAEEAVATAAEVTADASAPVSEAASGDASLSQSASGASTNGVASVDSRIVVAAAEAPVAARSLDLEATDVHASSTLEDEGRTDEETAENAAVRNNEPAAAVAVETPAAETADAGGAAAPAVPTNPAPTLVSAVADQNTNEDNAFALDVSGSFSDPGDSLTFTAQLSGGGALPSWLSIDPSTGILSGTPANDDVGAITVEVTATDTGGQGIGATFQLTVANVNDTPTLVAAIADQGGTEDIAFAYDVSSRFADVDTAHGDSLAFSATLGDGSPLPSWLSIDASTGVLSGTPGDGDVGAIDVRVTATDNASAAVSDTFQLTIANVNDAPVLDIASSPSLTAIAEDTSGPAGNTVAEIVTDGSITDADGSPVEAIAVTSVDNANGTWEYSTDGGTTFNAVGAVSDASALLLDASAKLRFVPDADYNGSATFGYKAWDKSSGADGDTGVDTTTGTAFSAASEAASITVTAVNDAPVLDNAGSPTLTAIAEDTLAPAGNTVAEIVTDGSITDVDGSPVEAIAVTSVDDANGTWEYSTDGGSTFNAVGAVSDASALLLDASAKLRFVPDADYNGTATIGYKAWDQSSGSSGDTGVDTTAGTAFSSASETASITVTAVNDAPVLDNAGSPTLTAIAEDAAAPAGNTVAEIVTDGSITDADGSPVEAIAVTSVDDANGTWEYSTDGGTTFNAVGGVSDSAALLLDASAKLRFVPDADYNGTATMGYKAWDQSSGSTGDTGVDTTTGTAFSSASETASITVTAVNDAPVLDNAGSPTLTAIAEDTSSPAGNTVAEIVTDGSITDVDGSPVEAIAVTSVDDTNGTWEYSTDGGSTFNAVGAVSDNSALLLDSSAMLRFVPDADYNGTATIGYKAWDKSSGADGDTGVDTTAGTAFSAASETASITVTAVDDAPVLDTSGSPMLSSIAEDTASPAGDTVADIVIDGSITDADGSAVEAIAVTGVDDTNGTWEYSTDGGSTFNAVGAVTETSALLLDSTAKLRFVPGATYNGTATFDFKAWDQSSGANGESGVDTTVGISFSTATETASITIEGVNNAPVLDTSGSPSLTAIVEDVSAPAGNTVAEIVIDGSITDPDGSPVEAIAVTSVDDANGTWEYSTDGGSTFNAVGAVSDGSALLLDSAAMLRFVPDADFSGTATFGYKAWDKSTGAEGDTGVDTMTGTAYSAASETASITVTAVNDAPVLDNAGSPTLTAIAEDASAPTGNTIAEIVTDGSITDPDGSPVEAIAVTSVDDTNGTWEYSTDGGSTFNAVGAVSDNSALLLDAMAKLRFVPDADYNGTATIGYKAWDQSSGSTGDTAVDTTAGTAFSSASETASITVTAVNDAPVLDNAGSPTLTAIAEDASAPAGNTVAEIVTDGSITDADGSPVEAIAVTSVDETNGTWEYSTDGGSTFNAVGAVSDASALLLDSAAKLRFVPDADYNGTATIGYKAWDQSSGSSGDTGVDTTTGTAFSAASETASITVTAVNDAPVLDNAGNPTLTAIAEDASAPAGNTVAEIVTDGSITDADGSPVEAIAVTSVDDTNGTWEYSTDGGSTFNAVGAVSDASALLLNSAAMLRFVPDADYNGTATIGYKAWDQSSGSTGDTAVDTTAGTAFSSASETASITVTAVNDAPVLDNAGNPTLTAIAEDASAPAGNTVAEIVTDGSITDADGSPVEAIAVTSVDETNGTWEYSTDGGSTFNAVGAVSDASALLLDSAAKLRFVPDADYNGTATIGYKAWDQSSGSSGDTGVDTTTGTAFSAASETASITVTAVNDAPVLDNAGNPTLTAIAEDASAPAGNTVAEIVTDGSITDADGSPVEAIAVTSVDDTNGTWEYSTDGGSTFNAVGAVSDASALLLNSAAMLRFVPDADYNGTATIGYKAWDQSSGSNGDTSVDTTTGTAFSAASETASITVTAVNDAPVLDNAGSPTLTAIAENTAAPSGNTVAEIVIDGSVTDADGGAVEAIAVTRVDDDNGTWEYSTDGGSTFNAVGAVSESSALLLNASAVLRFVPDAEYFGLATFNFKAWDQTSGSNGDSGVDTTVGTAFSSATDTAQITVTAVPATPDLSSGSEFQVNTTTANAQDTPATAALEDGGYVIVWSSNLQDGDKDGVFAQRYDADGVAVGSEFQVNTTTAAEQDKASIAGLSDGSFVVVWESKDQDGDAKGIFGQRYDASGNTLGGEFQINTETSGDQTDAQVVALNQGGFVVTWESKDQDGDGAGVYAQRYDANGNTAGSEFQVNTTTTDDQETPVLAALGDGGFVIVWQSRSQDGDGKGIFGQRFDSTGNAVGSEFAVNTYTTQDQKEPAVTALDDGGFIVAWTSKDQDGDTYGVYAQRYDSSGNTVGSEFLVNTTTAGEQKIPAMTALDDGGFLIAWQAKDQDGDGYGIYAQRYDSEGNGVGGEFLINTTTANDQKSVDLAKLKSGGLVVAWESTGAQDGDNDGIFAHQFDAQPLSAPEIVGANTLDFGGTNSYVDIGDPGGTNGDLDLGTSDLTVEAWFYYDGSGSGEQVIVSKYNQTHNKEGYSIRLSDGELIVQVNATGGNADIDTAASSLTMVGGEGWYHVAMVVDQESGSENSTVTGYLNGSSSGWTAGNGSVADDTFTMNGSGTDTDKSFMIGAVDNGPNQTKYFDSQIADVRVWDTARSQADIQADMSRTLNGNETNLVGNWRLDEGSGTTVADSVSGGTNGTIGGSASWQATDSFSMAMDGTLDGRVTATDTDGDTLTFSVSGDASNGTATIDANTGAWEYTPDNGYTGGDSFSYQVSDGNGGVDTVTISVTVA